MHNILTINPIIDKRITSWAKKLRQYNILPVATIGVDTNDVVYVHFDENYDREEIHYVLESALTQVEEEINQDIDGDLSPIRLDIN